MIKEGYKNLTDIITNFIKITGINENFISKGDINILKEIKASRNLLFHNNLIINNKYVETAGPNYRDKIIGNRLEINLEYFNQSLISIKDVLTKIKSELSIKYSSYTKINATRSLFKYIFTTQRINFDEYFAVSIDEDEILALNENIPHIDNFSKSERFFLNIWLAHFTSNNFEFEWGMFYSLDPYSKEKLKYLISNIDILK